MPIRNFVRTARRYRTIEIQAETRTITAAGADRSGRSREPVRICGSVTDARYLVRRSHQGAPVVRRPLSELVSTDVAVLDNAATRVRRTFF